MQFNRKWWTPSDIEPRDVVITNPNNFIWTLKKFNFVYLDGTEINGERGYESLKYKYDNNSNSQIRIVPDIHNPSQSYWAGWQLTVPGFEYSNVSTYLGYPSSNEGWHNIYAYFIPLKNQGLLTISYNNPSQAVGLKPVLPLWNPGSRPFGAPHNNSDHVLSSNIIFFNNIDNLFNYISLEINNNVYSCNYRGDNWNFRTFYYQNSRRESLTSTLIDTTNTGINVDVKQNICTMIKYPYLNGFLSNLFLITTAPVGGKTYNSRDISTDYVINDACGLDGKFFSFNGRNFYGVYANLAVELPAN